MECLDRGKGFCDGPVRLREPLTETGRPFPRCSQHWARRLELQERLNRTYPVLPPRWFDPLAAGERWDEEEAG